ncbi:dopamine receptor 2 isoform X1 [Exaiptasia diaphana]|uniref:G-protein coupled receptors family 1 profile domain-containing protein n=1 Tax=Exaiptasia diaphana TaxID=2652724 RepID=A0A913WZW7_EXADI|nr:dopamine receptor 2 isoform X1 [Exaiptasia diaphana]XP_020896741.1 dopamine receptor 2 isoform X1 [Exaiptasia diaphana]XP_020896742.1 dopamine receptor 2 isoform X1 [Exaiptasia diaphana]XP_028513859.1 dopamine receptor 2 isoform X1 [Exaiptasia diaphana]XP_028513861.1 dopamine receptor 2 isoform X1 [Exaiptasia diaphana]
MNGSLNSTKLNLTGTPYEPVWIWLTSLLLPFIYIGNVLVIVSYFSNRLLHTRTYTLLVSLAVSDLIVGLIAVPFWIECMIHQTKCIQNLLLFKFLDLFSAFASILHLTTITIERYVAICRPYFHARLSSRFHVGALIFVWTFPMTMAGLSWCFTDPPHRYTFNCTVFVLGFALPVTTIISMYVGIFRAAKSLLKRQQRPYLYPNEKDTRKRLRDDRKVAVTVAVICGFFIVAWLPFFALSIIAGFCEQCLPDKIMNLHRMVAVVKLLHYGNSMVNPVVYTFRDREMRNTFVKILRIKVCWRRLASFRRKEKNTTYTTQMTETRKN